MFSPNVGVPKQRNGGHVGVPIQSSGYWTLVFTKSVDSNFRAFWSAPLTRNILGYSLFCEGREKWRVVSRKFQKKKLKQHFFYPSDLVNTKTTIPLRVGEELWIYTSTLRVAVYIENYAHWSRERTLYSKFVIQWYENARPCILYGFLVSKETVVLRRWESETEIGFHQTSWWRLNYHREGFRPSSTVELFMCRT